MQAFLLCQLIIKENNYDRHANVKCAVTDTDTYCRVLFCTGATQSHSHSHALPV